MELTVPYECHSQPWNGSEGWQVMTWLPRTPRETTSDLLPWESKELIADIPDTILIPCKDGTSLSRHWNGIEDVWSHFSGDSLKKNYQITKSATPEHNVYRESTSTFCQILNLRISHMELVTTVRVSFGGVGGGNNRGRCSTMLLQTYYTSFGSGSHTIMGLG